MDDLPIISCEILMSLSRERLVDVILLQAEQISILKKRIDELEFRLNANSSNSSKPPSSDSPFARKASEKKGKPGAKKGHKGVRQQLLEPTDIKPLHPNNRKR
jgi:transposase